MALRATRRAVAAAPVCAAARRRAQRACCSSCKPGGGGGGGARRALSTKVREMIITPMFVEAAKATLHFEETDADKVYMLASFTDLAL